LILKINFKKFRKYNIIIYFQIKKNYSAVQTCTVMTEKKNTSLGEGLNKERGLLYYYNIYVTRELQKRGEARRGERERGRGAERRQEKRTREGGGVEKKKQKKNDGKQLNGGLKRNKKAGSCLILEVHCPLSHHFWVPFKKATFRTKSSF